MVEPPVPAATVPYTSPCPAWRFSSLGDRLIAVILDSVVLLGASAVISAWSFTRWGVARDAELHLTTASLLIAGALSAAIFFLYPWLLEAGFGATLGKLIVGIRVVCTKPRSPLAATAIRNSLRVLDGIGFYLVGAMVAGCSRLRQRLGDMLAGTIVVEEKFPVGIKLLAVVLWTATLAGAGWSLSRLCSGQVPAQPPRYFGRSLVQFGCTADSAAYVRTSRLRIDLQFTPAPPQTGAARVDPPPH